MTGNETPKGRLERLDAVMARILLEWYERCRHHYVTEEDSRQLGVEPEVKYFADFANHRLKFNRRGELDVTYGLAAEQRDGRLLVIASVNNKSTGFDYDAFVRRLQEYYWRTCLEKPWTEPGIDHYSYGDLLHFDPRMGHSVSLDVREEGADIVRLAFELDSRYESLLLEREDLLHDLIENYCLNPLKRLYAESLRETSG